LAFVPKGTRRPSGWEGGGDSHGAARLVLSHGARASAGGRKAEEKEEEVADGWGPHGSEQSKGVGGSWAGWRWWTERLGGLAG
jgi:hypothetical protein